MKNRKSILNKCFAFLMLMVMGFGAMSFSKANTVKVCASSEIHNHDGWINWGDDEIEKTSLPTEAGSYYLSSDISLLETWSVPTGTSENVLVTNLCLNGHIIRYVGETELDKSLISLLKYGKLNLYDCETNVRHYFNKEASGLWVYAKDQSQPTDYYVDGGVITGAYKPLGGAILVSGSCEFNMYGGNIVGNIGRGGAAIRAINGSVFNMFGGLITGNLDDNSTSGRGGVFIAIDNFTIGGTAQVIDNVDAESNNFNLCLYRKLLNIGTGEYAPKEGVRVGVSYFGGSAPTIGQFTTNGTADYSTNFFSDNDSYKVFFNSDDKYLELKEKTIADILPAHFPTRTGDIPDNAWGNDNGATIYIYTTKLAFDGSAIPAGSFAKNLSDVVTASDGNYTCQGPNGNVNVTFNMSNGKLASIVVDGYVSPAGATELNGEFLGTIVHTWKDTHDKVEPTCLTAGHEAYYECDCGAYLSNSALTEEIPNLEVWLAEGGGGYIAPLGHNFGGKVTYTWNEETHECTASHKCQREGCTETQSELASIENGKVVYVKDFDATCTANEKGHYEATFTVQEFEKQTTSMFDVPNTAKGHNYGTPTYTWNEDYTKCTATATCSHGDSTITDEGTITIEDGYAVATFVDDIFEIQRVKLPEPTPEKSGLSGGTIAGIAVGSFVGLCLIAYVVMFFIWKKTEKALNFLVPSYKWINKKIFKK